jgi:sugar O-acyltransferase (sialic acid O-acetyltransferase NeuD family)
MTKTITIYGAGGFGRETLEMIRQINKTNGTKWNPIGFFDDAASRDKQVEGLPVLGGLDEANGLKEPTAVVITISDPLARRILREKLYNTNLLYPTLIHPAAIAGSELNQFREGVVITAGVILTTGITVESFSILNLSSTIGHDVAIGKYCTLMPACHISGNVKIQDQVMIGTGACVLQNLTIGLAANVGAGAVVTKNVRPSVTVTGIPAREKIK